MMLWENISDIQGEISSHFTIIIGMIGKQAEVEWKASIGNICVVAFYAFRTRYVYNTIVYKMKYIRKFDSYL